MRWLWWWLILCYAVGQEKGPLQLELPLSPGLSLACSFEHPSLTSLFDCARSALADDVERPVGLVGSPEDVVRGAIARLLQERRPQEVAVALCAKSGATWCTAAAEALLEAVDSSLLETVVAAVEAVRQRRAARVECGEGGVVLSAQDAELIAVDAACRPDVVALALQNLASNSGLLVAVCDFDSFGWDVSVAKIGDECVAIVRRRPARPRFVTDNVNQLLYHALVWKSGDVRLSVGLCNSEEARAQGRLWSALRAAAVGDPMSWDYASLLGCPQHIERVPPQRNAATLVYVGANKGYGLARALRLLAPDLGVSPSAWGNELRSLGALHACGWCRDCLEDPRPISTHARVDAYLVEPLEANVELLRAALAAFGFVPVTSNATWIKEVGVSRAAVHLHQVAAGDSSREGRFPMLAAGDEVGALCTGRCDDYNFRDVRVERLDELLPAVAIDELVVDAEGADPLVLAGASSLLGATRLLQFEYHFRGSWAPPTSLRNIVEDLDAFDCYLQGPDATLWRLSAGCWDDAFEFREWSNVVCANSSDVHAHAALSKFAVLPWVT